MYYRILCLVKSVDTGHFFVAFRYTIEIQQIRKQLSQYEEFDKEKHDLSYI